MYPCWQSLLQENLVELLLQRRAGEWLDDVAVGAGFGFGCQDDVFPLGFCGDL
jgi:hypothetical protein